jgi:hypothetical protein
MKTILSTRCSRPIEQRLSNGAGGYPGGKSTLQISGANCLIVQLRDSASLCYCKGCLVPLFSQKILGFGLPFCKIKLNTMQIFWQKEGYSPFWILASRGQKNTK